MSKEWIPALPYVIPAPERQVFAGNAYREGMRESKKKFKKATQFRHSRENGNPKEYSQTNKENIKELIFYSSLLFFFTFLDFKVISLDSRLRGNDERSGFLPFPHDMRFACRSVAGMTEGGLMYFICRSVAGMT
ncbi:MAG: hypothetical protein LBB59_01070 [Campylobacteraceae bacterium]|nr:hypothetical protein [Campylobacteraceae bacterium]